MKKLTSLLAALCLGITGVLAQFTYTGGPQTDAGLDYLWASGDSAFVASGENLWRTTDGGSKWEIMLNGLPLGIDPRAITYASGIVHVGTNNGSRVYMSSDFGATWEAYSGETALWIPTHATSNGKVALMGGTTFEPHYYDNTSEKWVSSGLSGTTHALRYLNDSLVIAAVGSVSKSSGFYSTDGGKSWTAIASEPTIPVVNISGKTYDYIELGNRWIAVANLNGYNPYYSDDNGSTWIEASGYKIYGMTAYGRKLVKTSDGKVYVGTSVSVDSGRTWTQANYAIVGDVRVWKNDVLLTGRGEHNANGIVAVQLPATTSNLLSSSALTTYANGYFHRYNGSTWVSDSMVNETNAFNYQDVNQIAQDGDSIFFCSNGGLFGSNTGKELVSVRSEEFGYGIIGAYGNLNGTKLVGTISTRGNIKPKLFYLDGSSWTEAKFSNNIGFGIGGTANGFERFFVFGGKLYADMIGGYAVSADGGKNWTFKGGNNGGNVVTTSSIMVRRKDDGIGFTQLLEMSTDGDSWTTVLTGLPGYSGQANFADFGDVFEAGGKIYADVWGDDVHQLAVFNESKKEWEVLAKSSGLPDYLHVTDIQVFNDDLYASVLNGGVYKQGESSLVLHPVETSILIYPNPCKSTISVEADNSITKLSIYNLSGNCVGEHASTSSIDVSYLESGVYLIRIELTGNTITRKIIVQ